MSMSLSMTFTGLSPDANSIIFCSFASSKEMKQFSYLSKYRKTKITGRFYLYD
jgi:hypothetical protein